MKKTTTSVKVSFEKESACDFYNTLKERVHHFLNSNNLGPKASLKGHTKSLFCVGLCVLLYTILVTAPFSKNLFILFFAGFGFVAAVSVMNIAHDALHGSYAAKSKVNRAIGFFGDIFGPSTFFWRKEHTVDHHIFTNIADHDADLGTTTLLRLCPNQKLKKIHRFQVFYAPLLYSINLIHWIFVSDYKRLYRIYVLKNKKYPVPSFFELAMLGFFKTFHVICFLYIPYKLQNFGFGTHLLAYLSFLSVLGLSLTTIFQLAHIVENVTFPLPNQDGKIFNTFAKHQLATTSNFGKKSRLVRFLFGGLSFQIEHHLFPHLYHGYLHLISPIVQKTAEEFDLPYFHQETIWKAIASHFKTLYRLGNPLKKPSSIGPLDLKGTV